MLTRMATVDDVDAINGIYNHYVLTAVCTFHLEPVTHEERLAWLRAHGERRPVIVAEIDGHVVGWASLSHYRERPAYRNTAENSVYVHPDHHGKGIGKRLMMDLLNQARAIGYHTILAGATASETASIKLHESLGFTQVARLKEVGYKFDRWHDVLFLQLMLE